MFSPRVGQSCPVKHYSFALYPHEYGFSLKEGHTGMSVVFLIYLLITWFTLAGLKRVILVHEKHLFSMRVY
jgi:hypothetical protein